MKQHVSTDYTTKHTLAAAAMVRAVAAIKAALGHESGLEWARPLNELLEDAKEIAEGLERYSRA